MCGENFEIFTKYHMICWDENHEGKYNDEYYVCLHCNRECEESAIERKIWYVNHKRHPPELTPLR